MNRILIIGSTLWIVLHYIIPHLYTKLCVPLTPFGFIESIILATAPHCEAMRYALYISGDNIKYMWLTMGAGMLSLLADKLCAKVPK
jgi:hypothetical protein